MNILRLFNHIMKIDENYPQFIKIDSTTKKDFLQDIIDKSSGTCFAGQEQGDICLLAAAIGFSNGAKKKSNNTTDIRLYRSISDEYKVLIRAIALSDSKYDYNILSNGSSVLKIIEEYANGGLKILHDKIYSKGFDMSIEEEISGILNKLKKESV